ncbi:transcription factor 20 isoform X2 [Echeneis naucrates]|uniref:transcription factor 20 isoform X2 n=1 Tax=Echeneis naucrates TaxID=173247 RepID=UPI001114530A|nr:transcription factor 20-like isoform X2 [Echeneis naucrates]
MEVSSQDPSLMAMDLSKSYSPLTRGHAEAMDLAKKPEWYHRRPASCSTDIGSSYRSRASSSSYGSLSAQPGAPVHCRDMDPGPEALAKEPLICSSFIQDSVRHIVEPLSPAVSSLDEGRGCYHLPQPLSSPSPDSSYSEDSSDSSVDIPVHHTRPVVLLSDLSAVYGNPAESPVDISSDDSDVIEVSVTNEKKKSVPCPYKKTVSCKKSLARESPAQSEGTKAVPKEVRRSSRIRKPVSETPQFACSASRHSLRRQVKNDAVGIYNENCDSDGVMEYAVRSSSTEADEAVSQPNAAQRVSGHSEDSDTDVQTEGESQQRKQRPRRRASFTTSGKRKKPLVIQKAKQFRRTKPKQKHRLPPQQHLKASACRSTSANNKTATRRKRKRRTQPGPSALFSPREPEIKLKYANIKDDRKEKDRKLESFCPFVHVEHRICTVVNYQEDEATVRGSRGRRQQTASRSLSGFVPSTSCFQLGRLSSDSRCPDTLLCCLCGQTANITGLGDLHGPYYPSSPPQDCQTCRAEQKEEEDSRGLSNSHLVNSSDGDRSAGTHSHGGNNGNHGSLPKVPLHLDECWIHEDCGIWSTGVFLVRGKLFGLGEAARLAQETVCSTCRQTGAIMGCFQKGCPRNYHYRCAIQSGCVLNEENFSMRCTEHKNKTFTTATRQHKR